MTGDAAPVTDSHGLVPVSRGSVTVALWVRKGPFPWDLLTCPFSVPTAKPLALESQPQGTHYTVSQPKGIVVLGLTPGVCTPSYA